jgi:hypothetical protein
MSDSDEEGDAPARIYEIGYCKPPQEHRFKPGHKLSKGRPRGSRNTKALFVEEWHRLRPGLVNGKKRRVSRSQKGASHVTSKASDGDLKSIEIILKAEAELAEKGLARQVISQFAESGDEQAMADIVRRLRCLPMAVDLQSPAPPDEPDEAAPSHEHGRGSAGDPVQK